MFFVLRKRASAIGLTFISACAFAQGPAWKPERPVTMVVPYAAGGGTDATARAVARSLSVVWGQPVIVENQAGADGLIGTRRVMDAKPDGYTLLLQIPSLVLTKYLPEHKGIDPLAKLEPVSALAESPAALVVSGTVPVKTVAELIQYCKTAKTPCSAGSGENSSKVRAKWFAAESGLKDLIVVNYKGTAPIVPDLINGTVTMAFTGLTAALPHHKKGSVRIIMTQGQKRAKAVPEVPNGDEQGMKGYYSVTWYGLFAPKGTPATIVESIAQAVQETGKDPGVRQAIEVAAAEPLLSTPKEFAMIVERENAHFAEMVKRFPLNEGDK
jgi:tripartite-type tricarboxylate transporter receptor subunit TctC